MPSRLTGRFPPVFADGRWRVDLAIMRLAVFEMQYTGLPAAIAINEAVELTRKYSGEESCPFVNGVLGTISRKLAEKE